MTTHVSVSATIQAAPETVYDLVADLPRMGEWSPENRGGRWVRGSSGPAVGARFKGHNRNRWHRWNTIVTITAADRGRRFAFHVSYGPVAISDWSYEFDATADGTVVTETWVDRRPAVLSILGTPIAGVSTAERPDHNRAGMERTLAALKATAEQAVATA
jgi:hypothetical protein